MLDARRKFLRSPACKSSSQIPKNSYHALDFEFVESVECVTRPPRARTEIKSGSSRSLNPWQVSQDVSTSQRSSMLRSQDVRTTRVWRCPDESRRTSCKAARKRV